MSEQAQNIIETEIDDIQAAQIMESLPLRQQAYALLRENGFPNTEAAKALEMSRRNGNIIDAKLRKYNLTGNAKRGKWAARSYDNLLQGKAFGDVEKVKDSTVLGAVQMWYDRNDPVRRADSQGSQSISFTQINLNISNSPAESGKDTTSEDIK